MDVYSITVCYY